MKKTIHYSFIENSTLEEFQTMQYKMLTNTVLVNFVYSNKWQFIEAAQKISEIFWCLQNSTPLTLQRTTYKKHWNLKKKKVSTIQKVNKLTNTFTFLLHFPSYIEKRSITWDMRCKFILNLDSNSHHIR